MRRDEFKSDEEYEFYQWLLEAKEFGFISGYVYEPETFTIHEQVWFRKSIYMKTKVKQETVKLYNTADDLTYTPDFVFHLTDKGRILWRDNVFARSIQTQANPNHVYVDVKGTFNQYGGDHRAFYLKQRALFEVHKIFAHKIIPRSFFAKTFAPECMRWCKGRKVPTLTKLGTKAPNSRDYYEANLWRMQRTLEL